MPEQASDQAPEVAIPNPAAAPPAAKADAAAIRAPGAFGQRGGQRSRAILYDSDFGRDIDTVLALAVLSNLGTKGKLAAVAVSNSSLEAATFCDAVNRFYAGEPSGPFGGRGGLVVGLSEAGAKLDASSPISKPLAMKGAEGKPLFPHGINELTDTADAPVVFRNALAAQQDGEATFILAGPATNLIRLLTIGGGRDLVASKVSLLVVAGGSYPDGPADPRIRADVAAARQLFATWPTPIVAVGTEVGAAVPYPAQSIEKDFAWSPAHPVVEAYRANQPMPYDAPAQAVIAALYAANPSENFFRLSEPGIISIAEDGRTRFVTSAGGKHRYLMVDLAQKERVLKAFTTLASAKPAPSMGRGGRRGIAAGAAAADAQQNEVK
jgi:hypothetical protein